MAEYGVILHGMDQFLHKVQALTNDVNPMLGDSARDVAEATVKEARPEVPVLTGKAADSLQVSGVGATATAEGGEGLPYYAWLEYGGTAGHIQREIIEEGRYLYPAYVSIQGDIIDIMEEHLDKAIDRAGLD
jgi:hypothetical protein